jgi:hypothetical protein
MRRVQFLTLPYFSWSVASLPGPGNNIGLEQVVRRRRHYRDRPLALSGSVAARPR